MIERDQLAGPDRVAGQALVAFSKGAFALRMCRATFLFGETAGGTNRVSTRSGTGVFGLEIRDRNVAGYGQKRHRRRNGRS